MYLEKSSKNFKNYHEFRKCRDSGKKMYINLQKIS